MPLFDRTTWVPVIARLATVTALLVTAMPARADFADTLFGALKKVTFNPDYIEMAAYSIKHPENAGIVYGHAAKQDYPFFALVGAVKAAKNQTFPAPVGKFTVARCLTPVTVIDVVFGKADSAIDDQAGKVKTKAIVGQAAVYAAQYAKAETADAKQQIKDALSKNVPYFDEIPTICEFAFDTDFSQDRNIQAVAGNAAQKLRDAYVDFKHGHILDGVDDLVAAGLPKGAACDIVDSAIAGGIIGDTPVIGKLALGACKGFTGKVIGAIEMGVHKVGKAIEKGADEVGDLAEDVGCLVVSFLGGCSHAPPPPPTADQAAHQYCSSQGGLKMLSTFQGSQTTYELQCGNGIKCDIKPDAKPVCSTEEERAAKQHVLDVGRGLCEPHHLALYDAFNTSTAGRIAAACVDGTICRGGGAGLSCWSVSGAEGQKACEAKYAESQCTVMNQNQVDLVRLRRGPFSPPYITPQNICEGSGGLSAASSTWADGRKHFACNNGRMCSVGTAFATCVLPSEATAAVTRWGEDMVAKVGQHCPDKDCRNALSIVRLNTFLKVKGKLDAEPFDPTNFQIASDTAAGDAEAEKVVAAADTRVEAAVTKWGDDMLVKDDPVCPTDKCRNAIRLARIVTVLRVKQAVESDTFDGTHFDLAAEIAKGDADVQQALDNAKAGK